MNKSVIVFGPPGCGKTSNQDQLKRHFGVGKVLDVNPDRAFRVTPDHLVDHLILCMDPKQLPGALLGLPCHEFTKVVFDAAMRATKGGAA